MVRWQGFQDRKIWGDVFDGSTLITLYKLVNDGYIDVLGGVINSGKEANIYIAKNKKNERLAVKIYLIETSDFKNITRYIKGDPRFFGIGTNKRKIIYTWCRKEYSNFMRAIKAGVAVPTPIAYKKNVLVMEFLGKDAEPFKELIYTKLKNPKEFFGILLKEIRRLYQKAGLVHADLSPFNVIVKMNGKQKPILIDMGQCVLLGHPQASYFLERDIKNLVTYFNRFGLNLDENKVLEEIKK